MRPSYARLLCEREGHAEAEQDDNGTVICSRCRMIAQCETCDTIYDERTELLTCKVCHRQYNTLSDMREAHKRFGPVLRKAMRVKR